MKIQLTKNQSKANGKTETGFPKVPEIITSFKMFILHIISGETIPLMSTSNKKAPIWEKVPGGGPYD